MTPHRIRLGPPWEVAEAPGGFRHTRRFGQPRSLGPGEQVWLVVESCPNSATAFVNGEGVGTSGEDIPALAVEITSLLRPRNELVIEARTAAPPGGVALEIRLGSG